IEGVLAAHPAVHEVAVIGVPDAEFGEAVKALVELAPGWAGSPETLAQLLGLCREKLAGYKLPRSIEFRSGLPRTESGKLQKRLLRDPYWEGTGRRI
ncbi:MAG: acyl-CoA synthetase, partial [Burkholderiales bacterium]|nr:acyl-CoA synthetase [Burkholderiales bacterium]